MKQYLVTHNVVIETATELKRYVVGQTVEMKATDAKQLNKVVSKPFLEALQTTTEHKEVAE